MDHRATILDCSSAETTERSLAALLHMPRRELHEKCSGFDLGVFYERDWSPVREFPARVLGFAIPDDGYGEAYFFHATRVIPAEGLFHDGIRPLGAAIESVWNWLWPLAKRYCTREAWEAFRRDVETSHPSPLAGLYRHKVSTPSQHGPYGFLVRAVPVYRFTTGEGPWHDYLNGPEIVEDICVAFQESFNGSNLLRDFLDASRPCLVKFRANADTYDLATALLYLCHSLHGIELAFDLGSCHDAGGQIVLPERISAVEFNPA